MYKGQQQGFVKSCEVQPFRTIFLMGDIAASSDEIGLAHIPEFLDLCEEVSASEHGMEVCNIRIITQDLSQVQAKGWESGANPDRCCTKTRAFCHTQSRGIEKSDRDNQAWETIPLHCTALT